MAGAREYGDPCGVARALDVVGERWALLVVRELLLGPKRFGGLLAGLPGISQNVVSQRLRDLEAAGVLARRRLGAPARATAYELTEQGYALEPVLTALAGWGRRRALPPQGELSVDALMLALRTSVEPSVDLAVVAGLEVGDDELELRLHEGELRVRRAGAEDADVALRTDAATLRALAFADLPVAQAVREGRLDLVGDPALTQRFFDAFRR